MNELAPDRSLPAGPFVRLELGGGDGAAPELPDGVALLTIDRPRANLLGRQVLTELAAAVERLGAEPGVRAVVLTGAGARFFSAGADLAELAGLDVLEATAFSLRGQEVLSALAALPKPVIAAIGGWCLGGGFDLALACDLRVASAGAVLGTPAVTLGVSPGWGATQRLTRLVGPGRAKELIFTGARLAAEEALRLGIVNRVAGPGQHLAAAFELAGQICAAAPLAVAAAKEAIDGGADLALGTALHLEAAVFGRLFGTDDQKEGVQGFLEKREPNFRGH